MSKKINSKNAKKSRVKNKDNFDYQDVGIAGGLSEVLARYGDAGAEFLKGLYGFDAKTGEEFQRGLQDIENYKINPDFADINIKQQAGFSAETASVSKRNAQAIIDGEDSHYARSEDLAGFGRIWQK